MTQPLSPDPVTTSGRDELPAYVSNGLIGLRVLDVPLLPGIAMVNGFAGEDQTVGVESAARAPYPIAADLALDGLWLTNVPHRAQTVEQAYDFSAAELTTRFRFSSETANAEVTVVTLCSRSEPTVVLQEVSVRVDAAVELGLRALVNVDGIPGGAVKRELAPPGVRDPSPDGSLTWQSAGGLSTCGLAYVSQLTPDSDSVRTAPEGLVDKPLWTEYRLRARPGRTYRMRQIASLVPSRLHHDPMREATRLVCRAAEIGFDELRRQNRMEWDELWKGRVLIDAADDKWQRLADAAFLYLNSSVHQSSPSSTSIFGLAQWVDYHYYYGHVMWDIDFFCVPPLLLTQPAAARALLRYRSDSLDAARHNARLYGRDGIQFPWESGPLRGEEAAPGAGKAAWYEDHVSLDVAWAFAQYSHIVGEDRFALGPGSEVVHGIADWIVSRVTDTGSGYSWQRTMGIAERTTPSDNEAFTTMMALAVLHEAIESAQRRGAPVPDSWRQVAAGLKVPMRADGRSVTSHQGFQPNEEKGATPGPLAGLFPVWHALEPQVERQTLDYYLGLAPRYIGAPMLSPLYGVWAAWAGDRELSLKLYEEGYAQLVSGRFLQTLEQHPVRYPDNPPAGPFFANLGGFLMGLMFGLTGIRASTADPGNWPSRPIVLPAGWRAIEIERAWVRGKPARIVARHGADRATIEFD